nr:MAG TPA: Cytosine specific methyltransferase [Caudoviricetes sp.]
MTLGSLFDGIGGWLLAARHAGVTPIWASEIEPFPCSVTARHFPDVKQLGDITKIDGAAIPPVDIICAGSPCQDLSIAGKREGLDGARSGLFRRAVDIVRAMRCATVGRYPRFFVWENVPGAFSSNKGMDFRAVLEEIGQTEIPVPDSGKWTSAGMVECDECQIAWRVLDAQYWGVPQRRRRIFLVADFATSGRCAGEILFERESVQGDSAAGTGTGEEVARGAEDCARATGKKYTRAAGFCAGGSAGVVGYQVECAATLTTRWGGQAPTVAIYDMTHADEVMRPVKDGIVPTLNAHMGTGGNQVPVAHIYGAQAASSSIVRRLTPTECERLQGLEDGYTEGGSDTARYKALGNGMAQPCATYIIKRIAEAVSNGRMETCSC